MNRLDAHRNDVMVPTPHALAALESRQLARGVLAPAAVVDQRASAVAVARDDVAMVLNRDAQKNPVAQAVEQMLAVNKLLTVVGTRKLVVGVSALGKTTVENSGAGKLNITAQGKDALYQFVVDSDGNVEGGSSAPEAGAIGSGTMSRSSLVEIVNTLHNIQALN